MAASSLLDEYRYRSLEHLEASASGELRLLIASGHVADQPEGADGLPGRPVRFDEDSAWFEVSFASFFAFRVRPEFLVAPEPDDVAEGGALERFTRSTYRRSLLGDDPELMPNVTHFGVYCDFHVVDVLSESQPEVVRVPPRPSAA